MKTAVLSDFLWNTLDNIMYILYMFIYTVKARELLNGNNTTEIKTRGSER